MLKQVADLSKGDKFILDNVNEIYQVDQIVTNEKDGTIEKAFITRILTKHSGEWETIINQQLESCNPYAEVTLVKTRIIVETGSNAKR